MEITVKEDSFEIKFQYDPSLVSAVKSLPSRRYNPDNKSWLVPVSDSLQLKALVAQIENITWSDGAKEKMGEMTASAEASINDSWAAGADVEVPCPAGQEYLPYQRAGINYALKRQNTLIADEMGLGKTVQAIGVANAAEAKTVIIVCPASLRINWLREWEKWDTLGREASVVLNGKQALPTTPVIIINYDILDKFNLPAVDLLVLDEGHYLKNPKAKRTKAVFGFWDKKQSKKIPGIQAKQKLILTGTPILNKPIEAYTLLKEIAPELFGNWKGYVTRYCNARQDGYGWNVSGASNLGELQERLRANCMVRRLKKDVLTELPAKRRQIIEFQDKAAGKESKAWSDYQDKIERLTAEAELSKCDSDEAYEMAVSKLNEAASAAFSEMAKLRHETAVAKVPHAIDFIKNSLESSDKVVVFAHHKDVIDQLKAAFPTSVSITGDTKLEDRQEAVDKFQNDGACQVFIGNIKAAGVGLTLTAASHVIFVELDWVPGNMSQAEDRCHRIGQKDSVLVQHLVLSDSLDATIAKRIIQKQAIIDKALDSKIEKDAPIIPVGSYQETPRKTISEESVKISDSLASLVLDGVKIISSYCDGAGSLDGMGFSKIDVNIGKSLAEFSALSKKQAVIALKLCKKYRRQLPESIVIQLPS